MSDLWWVGLWILHTLQTITSTRFDEFVIWVSDMVTPWFLGYPWYRWGDVDTVLNVLAERNPDFRIVFRGDFDSFRSSVEGRHDDVRSLVNRHLPLVSSKGLVKFERVPHVENLFRSLGIS